MFVKAIEQASKYTRPIHTISRMVNNKDVVRGAATLFFINEEGYALTCKHVIHLLAESDKVNKKFNLFKKEFQELPKNGEYPSKVEALKKSYELNEGSLLQMKNRFIDCVDTLTGFTWHLHAEHDLAILKFNGFNRLMCNEFATFKKDESEIKQGKFLCRLGYPFPEFNNYIYRPEIDDIDWTRNGNEKSPSFPIEGMITRFVGDKSGKISGIEMSTPGLRGQSGGPLFDQEGIVYGLQSRTKHLHLGFDLENHEIQQGSKKKKINDYSFIHLGECVHVSVIKEFLREHNVKFQEA